MLAALFLVVFASNVIQGITGFAGTLIALPFAILLVDLETAKQVLNFLGLVASIAILIKDHRSISWSGVRKILTWMITGLIIGIASYEVAPRAVLMVCLPLFVIAIAVRGLIKVIGHEQLRTRGPAPARDAACLVAAGIVHGLFVSGGPLLVAYATDRLPEKQRFRATLSACWIALNSIILVQAALCAKLTAPMMGYMAFSLLPMAAGVAVGGSLLKRMDQRTFMLISYLLLLASGASLLISI